MTERRGSQTDSPFPFCAGPHQRRSEFVRAERFSCDSDDSASIGKDYRDGNFQHAAKRWRRYNIYVYDIPKMIELDDTISDLTS